jgi:hypothetical protein
MNSETYQQCTLEKREGSSVSTRVLWGPSDKTIVGNTVKVEENDGSWTTDWVVKAVHGEPIDKIMAMKQSRDYTKQRKASDI